MEEVSEIFFVYVVVDTGKCSRKRPGEGWGEDVLRPIEDRTVCQ